MIKLVGAYLLKMFNADIFFLDCNSMVVSVGKLYFIDYLSDLSDRKKKITVTGM